MTFRVSSSPFQIVPKLNDRKTSFLVLGETEDNRMLSLDYTFVTRIDYAHSFLLKVVCIDPCDQSLTKDIVCFFVLIFFKQVIAISKIGH